MKMIAPQLSTGPVILSLIAFSLISLAPLVIETARTIHPDWPDAIRCGSDGYDGETLYLTRISAAGAVAYASPIQSESRYAHFLDTGMIGAFSGNPAETVQWCGTKTDSIKDQFKAENGNGDRLFAVVRSAVPLPPGLQNLAAVSCPDVIVCIDSGTNHTFVLWMYGGGTDGRCQYNYPLATVWRYVVFNNGVYESGSGGLETSGCQSLTLAALYRRGQAWNIVKSKSADPTTRTSLIQVPRWPDVLRCGTGTAPWSFFFLRTVRYDTSSAMISVVYQMFYTVEPRTIAFSPDGSFNASTGYADSSGGCASTTIQNLYLQGRAFNIRNRYAGTPTATPTPTTTLSITFPSLTDSEEVSASKSGSMSPKTPTLTVTDSKSASGTFSESQDFFALTTASLSLSLTPTITLTPPSDSFTMSSVTAGASTSGTISPLLTSHSTLSALPTSISFTPKSVDANSAAFTVINKSLSRITSSRSHVLTPSVRRHSWTNSGTGSPSLSGSGRIGGLTRSRLSGTSHFNLTTTHSPTPIPPSKQPLPPRPHSRGRLELLRGSSIEIDALLEVPQAFSNNPANVLSEEVQRNLRFARTRYLSILNDSLDPSIVNLNRNSVCVFHQATANDTATFEVVDGGCCIRLSATKDELLTYVSSNATFTVVSAQRIQVEFQSIAVNGSSTSLERLKEMPTDAILTLSVMPSCLESRQPMNAVTLTFLHVARPQPTPAVASAQTALVVTQLLVAASSGGIVAVSGARSTAVLGLFTCAPEFSEDLGVMDNPFRQRFSSSQAGQFLAASVMNHLLIVGLPLLHVSIGWIYSQAQKVSTSEGLSWAKFPSLSLIPLQFFVAATCSSSVIVLIYGTEPSHRLAAAVSLMTCTALVVAIPVRIISSLASKFVVGPTPHRGRARSEAAARRVMAYDPFGGVAPCNSIATGRGILERFKFRLQWILFFLDSDSKWVDADSYRRNGYTRANEMFFADYNGPNYWFMGVEVGVAAGMGVLEGIKLGPGKCTPVSVTILIVLVGFLILMVVRMPYHTLLDSYFNILVTSVQVTGAIYTAVGLATRQSDPYKHRSELMAMIGLYLLVGKAIIDLLMKVRELLVELHNILSDSSKKEDDLPSVQNPNLTERLLETIQLENVEEQVARRASSSMLLEVPKGERSPTVVLSRHPSSRSPLQSHLNPSSKWEIEWEPSDFVSLELPSRMTDTQRGQEGSSLLLNLHRAPSDEPHSKCQIVDCVPPLLPTLHSRRDRIREVRTVDNANHAPRADLEFPNLGSEGAQSKIDLSEVAGRLHQERIAGSKRKVTNGVLSNSLDDIL